MDTNFNNDFSKFTEEQAREVANKFPCLFKSFEILSTTEKGKYIISIKVTNLIYPNVADTSIGYLKILPDGWITLSTLDEEEHSPFRVLSIHVCSILDYMREQGYGFVY